MTALPAYALPGVNVQLTCTRGLSDADCDVRCCVSCHRDERLGDDELCGACLIDLAEMRADDCRIQCTPGCGMCGGCGVL